MRGLLAALALCVALTTGCGSDDSGGEQGGATEQRLAQVPKGLRDGIEAASAPVASDYPKPAGSTLQQIADQIGGGPEMSLAGSVYVAGRKNRLAFGVIDSGAGFIYGKTAVYIARTPDSPARGPYLAPADVLMTKPAYRSRQAATDRDAFAAIYSTDVAFGKPGKYALLAVTVLPDGKSVASPSELEVVTEAQDRVPDIGEPAPRVQTDTVASAGGNVESIDTRVPPSDMHGDFSKVAGRKPVALLFATPQLCQSRVCGPVVDIGLQMRADYGDRMEFIHQEVFTNNDPKFGVRIPLQQFGLTTEPWLFVVDRQGRVAARLEGSFGLDAFERALKAAL